MNFTPTPDNTNMVTPERRDSFLSQFDFESYPDAFICHACTIKLLHMVPPLRPESPNDKTLIMVHFGIEKFDDHFDMFGLGLNLKGQIAVYDYCWLLTSDDSQHMAQRVIAEVTSGVRDVNHVMYRSMALRSFTFNQLADLTQKTCYPRSIEYITMFVDKLRAENNFPYWIAEQNADVPYLIFSDEVLMYAAQVEKKCEGAGIQLMCGPIIRPGLTEAELGKQWREHIQVRNVVRHAAQTGNRPQG